MSYYCIKNVKLLENSFENIVVRHDTPMNDILQHLLWVGTSNLVSNLGKKIVIMYSHSSSSTETCCRIITDACRYQCGAHLITTMLQYSGCLLPAPRRTALAHSLTHSLRSLLLTAIFNPTRRARPAPLSQVYAYSPRN